MLDVCFCWRSRREGLNMALVLLNMSTPLLSDRDIGEVCIYKFLKDLFLY